jgi:hypothetical protein
MTETSSTDERDPIPPRASAGASPRRSQRAARWSSNALTVLLGFVLLAALTLLWVDQVVFDADQFANRATRVLESSEAREAIATEIVNEIIENGGSQLVPYRSLIISLAADVVGTPAFRDVFRRAVVQAHRSVFTEDGAGVALNLSGSLDILTSSLRITNPDVAARIPANLSEVIVDGTAQVRNLELWQTAEDLSSVLSLLLVLAVALGAALLFLAPSWRGGGLRIGVALFGAGVGVITLSLVAPSVVAARVRDPGVADAVRPIVESFVGDLRVLGLWALALGVIAAALSNATTPTHRAVTPAQIWEQTRRGLTRWTPRTPLGQGVQATVIIAAGLLLINLRDTVVPLLVVLVGAYLGYVGVFRLLSVIGRSAVATADVADAAGGITARPRRRRLALALSGAGLVAVVSVVGVFAIRDAQLEAEAAANEPCNGSVSLCDKRIDEVAFAASHNSMSAAAEPGWLFAQNRYGIAEQLEFGIRGFLVKSHYGESTGIRLTGGDLVITDRAAEVAVNPTLAQEELPPGAVDRANQLAQGQRRDPARRDVYLCHVQCELGAQLLTEALEEMKDFLRRNPDEVLILFIGDYVSTADTERELREAGMLDRLWAYDTSAPAPTLQQMIDAGRNILLLSEHSGPGPDWNNPGYGLFQDTPFTFTSPDQLTGAQIPASCAPNRGSPDAPLFQINHWITDAQPPSQDTAKKVNAYDVLMPRVEGCQSLRQKSPTLIGVNFYDQGDLLKVVDELNGVTPPGVR